MEISYLKREAKPDLAYIYSEGSLPLVIFCGGYRSDMMGTKASYLEAQCKARGQAYVRFDYSGHGQSEGLFEEGTIGSWADDAVAIFDMIAPKSCIVVGSSMGGWIGLLLAQRRAEHIKGYIGIAPAPDFTEDMYAKFSEEQQCELKAQGFVKIPNDYSDEPYHYSYAFYTEAKAHLLLHKQYQVPYPMRLLQGLDDSVVLPEHAKRVASCFQGDVSLELIKGGDHSLSRDEDLERLDTLIRELSSL